MGSKMLSAFMFDIARIVEGALAGDTDKVVDYCEQLKQHLIENGEDEAAKLIQEVVRESAVTMQLAHTSVTDDTIPIGADSSLPIADRNVYAGEVEISLPSHLKHQVDEFITFYQSSDRLRAGGVAVSPSMLMFGPPGCGKTQLAHHVASRLNLPLLTARTDALVSSYLGSTANNIRTLFDYATQRPCVLFLDEFDAIAKMRDDQHELGELKRVVISLLQNIDSLGDNHVLLAATNHEHLLDPAIWRRFAYKFEMTPPDRECRAEILRRFLLGRADDTLMDVLATITEGMSGSQLRDISETSIRRAIISDVKSVDRREIINHAISIVSDKSVRKEMDVPEQIRFLHDRSGQQITQDELGKIFDVSQSYVSKQLKKRGSNGRN